VTFNDWKNVYKTVKDQPIFNWIPSVVEGLREENMNLEVEEESPNYERRLTIQQMERQQE